MIFSVDTTGPTTISNLELVTTIAADLGLVGVYTLKLKVYFENLPNLVVEEREFDIEIIDPCLTETFIIDENDSELEPSPTVTLLQFIEYATRQIQWVDTIVSKLLVPAMDPCGAHTLEIWQIASGSAEITLDTSVFTISGLELPTTTLDVQTDDFGKVGLYTLRLVVYYDAYPDKQFSKDFLIDIQDYCVPSLVTKTSQFDPVSLAYTIGDPADQISTFASSWTTEPPTCNLIYKLTVVSTLVPDDPLLIVLKEDAPMSVTVVTSDVFFGGGSTGTRNAGTY